MWAVWIVLIAGCGFEVSTNAMPADSPLPPDLMSTLDAPAVDAGWSADTCPKDYISIGTSATRYSLHTTAMNVRAHHELCTQEGTHLAVLDSPAEALALRQFIDGISGLPSSDEFGVFVWIGAAQRANESLPTSGWINATGGTFDASLWNFAEPNDLAVVENGQEDVAALWQLHDFVADVDEDGDHAGLCECDGTPITQDYANLVD